MQRVVRFPPRKRGRASMFCGPRARVAREQLKIPSNALQKLRSDEHCRGVDGVRRSSDPADRDRSLFGCRCSRLGVFGFAPSPPIHSKAEDSKGVLRASVI